MSSYTDLKFINNISSRLDRFKRKNDYLFNFRCPHCGDSKKNKSKARAFFYRVKNDMFFKCHNCGMGQNLANFIKFIDSRLYDEYILERYKGSSPSTPKPTFDIIKKPVFKEVNLIEDLQSIAELDNNHPAKQYIVKRKIPEKFFDILLFTSEFMKLVNSIKPNTFTNTKGEHPRLIIPFYDTRGNIFAFQGRAFGKEQPKYLTIKIDESMDKIYGLERINFQKHIYVTEGPLDSLFIDNCLAAAGADLILKVKPSDVTYIFDNEPRNKEIVKRMYKMIEKNYSLFIWPDEIQSKDVNDLVLNNKSILDVQTIISTNTHTGLSALTKLNTWKKCSI
jgi:transcription elongation factor Elf1